MMPDLKNVEEYLNDDTTYVKITCAPGGFEVRLLDYDGDIQEIAFGLSVEQALTVLNAKLEGKT